MILSPLFLDHQFTCRVAAIATITVVSALMLENKSLVFYVERGRKPIPGVVYAIGSIY